jgi:DNA invertase Pin-like site-specific DNA recombinase
MKIHIYCRVSKSNGKFGTGDNIDIQIDECVKYCKSNGWTDVVVSTHELSGRKGTNIPRLNSILNNDMQPGDILMIYTVDRLSRYLYEGLDFLQRLDEKGCRIVSVCEGITYDADDFYGRFTFRNILNHAELESDRLSVRVTRARKNKNTTSSLKFRSISSTKFQSRKRKRNDINGPNSGPNSGPDNGPDNDPVLSDHMEVNGVATRSMVRSLNDNRKRRKVQSKQNNDTDSMVSIRTRPVQPTHRNYFLRNALEKYNREI